MSLENILQVFNGFKCCELRGQSSQLTGQSSKLILFFSMEDLTNFKLRNGAKLIEEWFYVVIFLCTWMN